MGCCFSCNEPRIEITDGTPEGETFNYLRPKGATTYSIDCIYHIPLIEINFDGLSESSVCFRPKNNKMRSNFLFLEQTSPASPSISFFFV